jgi:hypothetical protein
MRQLANDAGVSHNVITRIRGGSLFGEELRSRVLCVAERLNVSPGEAVVEGDVDGDSVKL